MSYSSRRKKDHRSGGLKKVAGGNGKVPLVPAKIMSAGKENSRPTTRGWAATQKRNLQSMAQMEDFESAEEEEEPRVRKGTSSVPRGRSSCPPFEFARGLSDTNMNSRVSQRNVNNAGRKYQIETRASKALEKEGGIFNEFKGISHENLDVDLSLGGDGGDDSKEGVLGNSSGQEINDSIDKLMNERTLDEVDANYPENAKKKIRRSCNDEKMEGIMRSFTMKESKSETLGSESGSKTKSVEDKLTWAGDGSDTGSTFARDNGNNQHRSKLLKKLAFLEEKVKQIASDIEQTKAMLDNENVDVSEVVLSDVHGKIAWFEKALSHAGHDGDIEMGSSKSDENGNEEEMDAVDARTLVEEVKARLSPHGKLNLEREREIAWNVNAVVDAEGSEVQELDGVVASIAECSSLNDSNGKDAFDALLLADEKLNDFDDQENMPELGEEVDESHMHVLNSIGSKISTAGWFVSEGESVILAHNNGSCSLYDIVNNELKAKYMPPVLVSPDMLRDCWIINAPGEDGCSGEYLVAASAGTLVDTGFCSWDLHTKDVKAFHIEDGTTPRRSALAPLQNDPVYRRHPPLSNEAAENRQWWYKPCGPLILSAASCLKMAHIYDIRDGDQLVKWELSKPVASMNYASPLHWKNKGKIVIAESDSLSVWDVSSPSPRALQSVSSSGQGISAIHVNNADAEKEGGVRQRISAPEAEGNDGVFCTPNSINVLDFRQPSGIGLKIPKSRLNAAHSVFSCGDSIYVGCTNSGLTGIHHSSQIQLFSLRKQRLVSTYQFPESNDYQSFTEPTQVWGNSKFVMGVCERGLFVFEKDSNSQPGAPQNAKEAIGPDNMYSPSFDYSGTQVLLISRDRPACWRYLF